MEKYEVIKEIGHGSYGVVYTVKKKEDGKKYVMKKILLANMSQREQMAANQEVDLLKRLNHPHIVAYEDSFLDNDSLCIVMEYCAGGDLSTIIAKANSNYFEEEQILTWFMQMVLAIYYIHSQKILHRDLKTQNVFLTEDGRIKLGDFGIARILDQTTDMAQTTIGSPYYLSPELCEDKPYNHKSDVWALGCVLYEITTLKHAFDGQNLPSLVLKILRGRYPPIPPKYSTLLHGLIDRMLQKNPSLRPDMSMIIMTPFIAKKIGEYISKASAEHKAAIMPTVNEVPIIAKAITEIAEKSNVSKQKREQRRVTISEERPKPEGEKKGWVTNQLQEMSLLFKELHPSLKIADEESKNQMKQGREELAKEKKRDRRSFFIQKKQGLTKEHSDDIHHEERPHKQQPFQIPPQPQPSKEMKHLLKQNPASKLSIPKPKQQIVKVSIEEDKKRQIKEAQQDMRIRRQSCPVPQQVEKKPNYDEKQLLNKLHNVKSAQQPKLSKREMKIQQENQQRREQNLKAYQEKKEQRKKEQEEAKQRQKEHAMKMKNIRPSMDWKKVKNVDEPSAPEPQKPVQTAAPVDPEEEERQREKQRLKEQKEKERQEERARLHAFMKQQRRKKQAPSGSGFELVMSEQDKVKAEELVHEQQQQPMKEEKPTPAVDVSSSADSVTKPAVQPDAKPVEEVALPEVHDDDSHSEREDEDNTHYEFAQQQVIQIDSEEDSEFDENESPTFDITLPDIEIEAPHLSDNNIQLPPITDTWIAAPAQPESITTEEREQMSHRIESLRNLCEKNFGTDLFISVYNCLKGIAQKDDESESDAHIEKLLGENYEKYMPFLTTVNQLIYCEDSFYG